MDLAERLAAAHQRSVALYLQRQDVEARRQGLQQQGFAIDQELLKLDGEIRVLDALSAEANRGQ